MEEEEFYELYELCCKFVQDQKIACCEDVYQNDRVIENAYEFIEQICDMVGYADEEEEDEVEDEDE